MSRRRMLAMRLRHSYYVRRELGLSGFCVYCGQVADSLDHVPPISLAIDLPLPDFLELNPSLLPCCRHCNSIIGDSPSLNLSSRREIVEKYIEKRYPSLLKAGALLVGVEFSMSDYRSMMAYKVFKRWEFATTTFIELPPSEPEENDIEVGEQEGPGQENPKDCCMPFALWCNSWQVTDARRIYWENAMTEELQDGLRILTIDKDRDLIERLSGAIPEWAIEQADTEAKRLKEIEDAIEAKERESKRHRSVEMNQFRGEDYIEFEEEEESLAVEVSVLEAADDDDEFSRALSALVLRNANGPESIGFRTRKNISEISEILQLDTDALDQLLQIKNRKKLYLAISELVIERIS